MGVKSKEVLSKTKYSYVAKCELGKEVSYKTRLPNHSSKYFDDIKDAARAVDKMLINQGKEPVNIYKRLNA